MSFHPMALTVTHTLTSWWLKGSNKSLRDWLMNMLPATILWNIWKTRNNHRFNNVFMSMTVIMEMIKANIFFLYKAANKELPTTSTDPKMLR